MFLREIKNNVSLRRMLKKISTYSVAVVLAFYLLLAGAGWNLTRFCCAACEYAGIEQVASRSCEAIHGQEVCHEDKLPSAMDDMACTDRNHHAGSCCHLLRLVLDNAIVKYEQPIPPAVELSVFSALPALDSLRALSDVDLSGTVLFTPFVAESLRLPGQFRLPYICIWLI